ncbi:MAG: pyridoxamine 5'-phosphate oxidase [Nitriliruptoraceae bacterium]|nr:pyridoxamine 5'-phosphate oxidase [Nitriliruptoraceae bacterium]
MGRLEDLRRDYRHGQLDDDAIGEDPLAMLARWVADAVDAELGEPNAATVATVDADGVPDARVVLLRGIDERGVCWYSNRRSAKGRQLAGNPHAAVVLFWEPLERQVRLRGTVEDLPDEESDAYFASRPRSSRIGAWASQQSEPIADRASLDAQVAQVTARFGDGEVARPEHWGGSLLRPTSIEFWQGRPSRLHDRLRFTRPDVGSGDWAVARLQP